MNDLHLLDDRRLSTFARAYREKAVSMRKPGKTSANAPPDGMLVMEAGEGDMGTREEGGRRREGGKSYTQGKGKQC